MKLLLKEPSISRYLHIGPDNTVNVLMPIMGGSMIGTDNTCKAAYSLQEFFGKGAHSNNPITLLTELLAYKEALEYDLGFLDSEETLAQQKQDRLTQINVWLEVLKSLEQHVELDCLKSDFPSYPIPLLDMMRDRSRSNVFSIILRPTQEDGFLRLEATNPIFSLAHQSAVRNIDAAVSPLQQALIQVYSSLKLEVKDVKFKAMEETLKELDSISPPVNFERLRQLFQDCLRFLTNDKLIDLTHASNGDLIDQNYIDRIMDFDGQTTTPQEYMDALWGFGAPQLIGTFLESPFDTLDEPEQWSVVTQFLLGLINVHGVIQKRLSPETNWGQILDARPDLSAELAQILAQAQQQKAPIEEACIAWINAHIQDLKLISPLTNQDYEAIKESFKKRYGQIKDSLHFDEFLLFDSDQKGDFVTHQASICTSFAKFVCHPRFHLSKALTESLTRAHSGLQFFGTEIPPHSIPKHYVSIDLKSMSLSQIQALHAQIGTYKDVKVRAMLYAQLKEERPDFKPPIDTQQFLQHVAYGNLKAVELFLKESSDRVHELLTVNNQSFTDSSGRSFTCTPYEYAYWAKDTHMCWLIEQYMDTDTRHELLMRIQYMEELVGSEFFKAPRGLAYTQNGDIHYSAHFDLKPLKQALKSYIDAYNNGQSLTDNVTLNELWLKVGLLQRDLPAHLVHEYCQPKYSFEAINKDSTLLDISDYSTLDRHFKFYNWDTDDYDWWFTPDAYNSDSGLGASFAIVRGDLGGAWGVSGDPMDPSVVHDLEAIELIDKAKTNGLKRSRDTLNAPFTPAIVFSREG